MRYYLDNGSGNINLKIANVPIIKWYLVNAAVSSFLPEKKGEFLIIYLKNIGGGKGEIERGDGAGE